MLILSETNRPYVIESLTQPLPQGARYHWVFSAPQLDFTLSEISYLEECTGPTITLNVDGAEVKVPGGWSILVVDRETYTIDAIPVTACASFEHEAFIFSPDDGKLITIPIKVSGWEQKECCVYPAADKGTGIVHAISPGKNGDKITARGVILCPTDLWRHIGGKTVGDILG